MNRKEFRLQEYHGRIGNFRFPKEDSCPQSDLILRLALGAILVITSWFALSLLFWP